MSMIASAGNGHGRYAAVLLFLTGLFLFRVGAQFLQVWFPTDRLPPFEAWQSGALPYPLLLLSQMIIVALCLRTIRRLRTGTVVPASHKGKLLLWVGGIYLMVMVGRFIAGVTIAPDHFWFAATLPTLFHMVLAFILLVYGWFHYAGALREAWKSQEVSG